MDVLYLYVVVAVMLGLQSAVSAVQTQRCKYSRERKMMVANCFDLGLEEIPTHLRSDIEILYAERNRIRTIKNSSLSSYSSLRFLYLGNNFITKIEPGAFSELSELECLDMTMNAIRSLPVDLPLPLRTLRLNVNPGLQITSLSAAFNLNFLNLAECDLKVLPSFGMLPNLKELNVTGNELKNVTPADLAPLCRLEKLHLPSSLYKQEQCECHRLLTWTRQRNIELPNYNCTSLGEDTEPDLAACDLDFSEELKMHRACLVATPAKGYRHLLLAVLGGALLLAILIVTCWWRKSRRKNNSVQDQKRTEKNTKAADTLIM